MFRLIISGPTRSDCTAPYDVVLDRAYTVAEFIETVLQQKDEWGYIIIRQRPPVSWFDYPRCEYRCGELLSKLPDLYSDQLVKLAEADGGWTRMDYILYV